MVVVTVIEQTGGWVSFEANDLDDAFDSLMGYDYCAASVGGEIVTGDIDGYLTTFYLDDKWFGEEFYVTSEDV